MLLFGSVWLSAFVASLLMGLVLESRGHRAEFRPDKDDTYEDYQFFWFNLMMWFGVLAIMYLLFLAIGYAMSVKYPSRMPFELTNIASARPLVAPFVGYCLALFVLAMHIIESKHADSYVFDFYGDQKVRSDSEDEVKNRANSFAFTARMVQCVNYVHLIALPCVVFAYGFSGATAPPPAGSASP
jgi:hypothetical protein